MPSSGGEKVKAKSSVKWYIPEKPDFKSLEIGDVIEGMYLGRVIGEYGPGYRFRLADGKMLQVNGNRVQLDNVMDLIAVEMADEGRGHLLILERLKDAKSRVGRSVGQYRVGHVFEGCPKGCAPF